MHQNMCNFGRILRLQRNFQKNNHNIDNNVTAVARIQGREIVNNGTNVMKVERLTVDFTLGKARFRVRDQLNANNVLGEAMNRFLNQNWAEIVAEMKPAATLSIGRHFKSFLNGAFTQVPITVWLWD